MLHVSDLTYRIANRTILDRASFALPTGGKVGLVGRNGAGKTTLFRIIQGEISPESGDISMPRGVKGMRLYSVPLYARFRTSLTLAGPKNGSPAGDSGASL